MNRIDRERIRIFDTTLRDGEQSPGASLTPAEKLAIAHQLRRLGVDVIEAGFAAASPDDKAAIQAVATEVGGSGGPIVAALARASAGDIESAAEAVRGAERGRIHTFLATSEIHLEHKLRMSREEALRRVSEMVAHAASLVPDVEFSPEDATRSDVGYLAEVLAAAIEAGATTLNIPDTVGYTLPDEYSRLIRRLIADTPGSDRVVWSVHCHDDLGLAVSNSLAGLLAGARQAEVTINGIGERAGNCSLEELAMLLATRPALVGFDSGIVSTELYRSSRMVAQMTGIQVPPNKAIVGANAFAHEAGIHQDGVLKDQRTYEIMRPETVGVPRSQLVLGKHSGRHALRRHLEELGVELEGRGLDEAFARFKRLADRKKTVTDTELLAIAQDQRLVVAEAFRLVDFQVNRRGDGDVIATVSLRMPDDEVEVAAAQGTGAIDAIYGCLRSLTGIDAELQSYSVSNAGEGSDTLGEARIQLATAEGEMLVHGYANDTDVVAASALALVDGVNRLRARSEGVSTHLVVPQSSGLVGR